MKKIIILMALLTITSYAYATTINIPTDYSTIQAGIDAASDYDTVLVDTGTYVENINYNGKNITVASLFLTTQDTSYVSQTVIDGDSSGSVITFENGEDSTAVLNGLTLNGNDDFAAIFCNNGVNPSISNNTFNNCYDLIIDNNSSPTITYNKFLNNPGVIICNNNSNPYICENYFFNCGWGHSGYGIISCYANSNAYIRSNIIVNNFSIGIDCVNSNPISINNTIANNSWGFMCGNGSNPNIINTIIWENNGAFSFWGSISHPTVSYSLIQGDSLSSQIINGGNILLNTDPIFVNSAIYNYHLTANSPCIDAGDPNYPLDPDGTIADMGAYYFDQGQSDSVFVKASYILDNTETIIDTVSFNIQEQIENLHFSNYPECIDMPLSDSTFYDSKTFNIQKYILNNDNVLNTPVKTEPFKINNINNSILTVKLEILNNDIDPSDNIFEKDVELWIADFDYGVDNYQFGNWYGDFPNLELGNILCLASINLGLGSYSLIFPDAYYELLLDFFTLGGHCMGIASSSILYKENNNWIPNNTEYTYLLNKNDPDVEKNIRKAFGIELFTSYLSAYLRGLPIVGSSYYTICENELNEVKSFLEDNKLLTAGYNNHATVIHTMIKIDNEYHLYNYDSNYHLHSNYEYSPRQRKKFVDNNGSISLDGVTDKTIQFNNPDIDLSERQGKDRDSTLIDTAIAVTLDSLITNNENLLVYIKNGTEFADTNLIANINISDGVVNNYDFGFYKVFYLENDVQPDIEISAINEGSFSLMGVNTSGRDITQFTFENIHMFSSNTTASIPTSFGSGDQICQMDIDGDGETDEVISNSYNGDIPSSNNYPPYLTDDLPNLVFDDDNQSYEIPLLNYVYDEEPNNLNYEVDYDTTFFDVSIQNSNLNIDLIQSFSDVKIIYLTVSDYEFSINVPIYTEASIIPGNYIIISTDGDDISGNGTQLNPYSTIQHGIDVCEIEDTIMVLPGTYVENINFNGKNITVASLFLTTQDTSYIPQTIIDGDSSGSVVTVSSGENLSGTLLCGLSLINGTGTFSTHNGNYYYGGGMWINNSGITINNVKIYDNSVSGDGGAICVHNGNLIVQNCEIFNNEAVRNTGGVNINIGTLDVQDSEIRDNNKHGIACVSLSELRISNCLFSNPNTNILYNNYDDAIIENTVIQNGDTGIFGWNSEMIIINCTVVDNYNGLFIRNDSNYFLSNNIFYYNDTEIVINFFNNTSSTATIKYCDIKDGEDGISCSPGCSYNWLQGNISQNPLFVDLTNGDYHLTANSPCIDAGDPDSPLDPDSTIADMGAYYYNQGQQAAILELPDIVVRPDTSGNFGINLENDNPVASGQIEFIYDSTIDFHIDGANTTLRTSEYDVAFSADTLDTGNVEILILFYNMQGEVIDPGSGDIIELSWSTEDIEVGTPLEFTEVILSNSNAEPLPVITIDGNVEVYGVDNGGNNNETRLSQNYPNPFHMNTNIYYSIKKPSNVKIDIYNLKGRLIETFKYYREEAGSHSFIFSTENLSNGIYFYELNVDGENKAVKKMIKIE